LLSHAELQASSTQQAAINPVFAMPSNVLGVARARAISDLHSRDSYRSVAAKVVFARDGEVLAVDDIDALHDMRVATRRLRAALEIFSPCLPRRSCAAALAEIKQLADALGERRDSDVQIQWLTQYAQARAGEERAAVLDFVRRLREQQATANEALAQTLQQVHDSDLRGRLQKLAQRADRHPAKRRRRHHDHAGAPSANGQR
jgi:CHAD domain-containing protein